MALMRLMVSSTGVLEYVCAVGISSHHLALRIGAVTCGSDDFSSLGSSVACDFSPSHRNVATLGGWFHWFAARWLNLACLGPQDTPVDHGTQLLGPRCAGTDVVHDKGPLPWTVRISGDI